MFWMKNRDMEQVEEIKDEIIEHEYLSNRAREIVDIGIALYKVGATPDNMWDFVEAKFDISSGLVYFYYLNEDIKIACNQVRHDKENGIPVKVDDYYRVSWMVGSLRRKITNVKNNNRKDR